MISYVTGGIAVDRCYRRLRKSEAKTVNAIV